MLARLSLLAVLLLAPAIASAEDLVIEKGKSVVVSIPFAIGMGVNSNPKIVQATPDLAAKAIMFRGREVGSATYVVREKDGGAVRIEYEIRVVEPGKAGENKDAESALPGDGERRGRVMDKIETVRIARMTDALELDSAMAEKLFPAVRPFAERRAAATRARGDAGKVMRQELEKGAPDAKVLATELDRFAAAQKDFNDASEEEYAVLKKVLEPVTLARYYQFQREFEHEVRGLLNEFREGNPAKEKREKWEHRQRTWDRENREDKRFEKGKP